MKIYSDITQLVGHTPLLQLQAYGQEKGLCATLLAKLECWNPAGSAKDRVALQILRCAREQGLLQEGSVIIEPTSGNTGIALAALSNRLGYQVILTMPETMSIERRKLLKAYGAKLVLTEGALGMSGAIAKAEELAREIPDSFCPGQFVNENNPLAHYLTTGPEIWQDTDGSVDLFVSGVGTGGTLSGSGRYLKEQNPAIRVVAVEPAGSPVLSGGKAGSHGLQGIGAGFIPQTLQQDIIDCIVQVTEAEAYAASRSLARLEGLLVGVSSGAALHAATELARLEENRGKTIVVLLPDSGERYLSTPMFTEVSHEAEK